MNALQLKHLLLLFLPALLFHPSFGQTLVENQISSQYNLGISDVIGTPDGGFLLCGSSAPSVFDSSMAVLLKTDAQFQVEWAKRYKTLYKDDFSCLRALSDNTYLVGGATRQDFNMLSGGVVYKVDDAGNVIWHFVFSESSDYRMLEMFEEPDGTLMMFVRHGVTNQSTKILHVAADGQLISERKYNLDDNGVFADGVTQGSNGNYFMAGWRYDNSIPQYISFICAIDYAGLLWYKRIDFVSSALLYGITALQDGGIVASGHITDVNFNTTSNALLVKVNSDGDVIWANQYEQEEPLNEYAYQVKEMPDGSITTYGQRSTLLGSDGFSINVSGDGSVNWSIAYDAADYDGLSWGGAPGEERIVLLPIDGGVRLMTVNDAGNTACSSTEVPVTMTQLTPAFTAMSPELLDPELVYNEPPVVISDMPITIVEQCTNTSLSPKEAQHYSVYPNPVVDQLHIDLSGISAKKLTLIDLRGRRLDLDFENRNGTIEAQVSDVDPGVYGLLIVTQEGLLKSSVIIER